MGGRERRNQGRTYEKECVSGMYPYGCTRYAQNGARMKEFKLS